MDRVALLKDGFRDVVGASGFYMVNENGVVISLPFTAINNGHKMKTSACVLTQYTNKKGYVVVKLSHPKRRPYAVHRIVANAFIPNPENKPYIDHIDGNPQNNNITNLRWCTHKENMNNPITLNRLYNSKAGVKCYSLMKSIVQFDINGNFINRYKSVQDAALKTGLNSSHISSVARGNRKTSGGYIWEYDNEDSYSKLKITEQEMQNGYAHRCTVGQLLKFIQENNIPMDSKIFIERVEDVYFNKHGWSVVEKHVNLGEGRKETHQYHVAWSPVKYLDSDKLYIDLHY